ncbi:MAG: DUF4388 domain-containing protein [Sphaerobacter sp.]|nr:DUF4388 domain-containing protein [Sphaerobacter sp.]
MGFYGDLADLPLADILHVLSSHGKSGRLTLSIPTDEITLVFYRGRVASVTSGDVNLRIGRLLVDQGYITEDDVEQALALQAVDPQRTRFGDVLVELGLVTRQQILKAVAAQFEASLFRILIQPGGTFVFTPDEVEWDTPLVEEIRIEPIVLNAVRMADEWLATHAMRDVVALADAPFVPETLDQLDRAEREVLLAVLNGATTLYEVAAKTGRGADHLDEVVDRLVARGLLTRATTPERSAAPD